METRIYSLFSIFHSRGSKEKQPMAAFLCSPGKTRTYDPSVNSRMLYQLSYRGTAINMDSQNYKLIPGSLTTISWWRWQSPAISDKIIKLI